MLCSPQVCLHLMHLHYKVLHTGLICEALYCARRSFRAVPVCSIFSNLI